MQWIKLQTDIFENPKMRAIMGDSTEKALMWIRLLTLAGRLETGGRFEFRSGKPYTVHMLACTLCVSDDTMASALDTFAEYEMVDLDGDTIVLSGWAEYQSVDAEARKQEQNRERQRRFRERQKESALRDGSKSVTSNADVTQNNAQDKEEDKDKDKDKDKKEPSKRFRAPSVDEVREYCDERKNDVDPETFVDFYASKGWKVGQNPMKDWKAAVRTWEKRHKESPPREARPRKTSFHNFEQRETAGGSWDELETLADSMTRTGDGQSDEDTRANEDWQEMLAKFRSGRNKRKGAG